MDRGVRFFAALGFDPSGKSSCDSTAASVHEMIVRRAEEGSPRESTEFACVAGIAETGFNASTAGVPTGSFEIDDRRSFRRLSTAGRSDTDGKCSQRASQDDRYAAGAFDSRVLFELPWPTAEVHHVPPGSGMSHPLAFSFS